MIFSNSRISLEEILSAVEAKKAVYQQKRWTVSRGPNKNALVLRDVFANIASWVEKFIAVGDTAVQYDPGHAALPWAVARFLLQVCRTCAAITSYTDSYIEVSPRFSEVCYCSRERGESFENHLKVQDTRIAVRAKDTQGEPRVGPCFGGSLCHCPISPWQSSTGLLRKDIQ